MRQSWILGLALLCSVPVLRAAEPARTVEVPYRLGDTKHLLVRAKINGRGPFTFILDTGSPLLFVNKSVADKIGLKPDADGWTRFLRFELEGGLVVPQAEGKVETVAPIEAMNGIGAAGTELHGLLGYNILARYRIEVDLTKDKLRFTPLNYEPDPPRVGKNGLPTSINALGAVLKVFGALLGRRTTIALAPRGFVGIELEDGDKDVIVRSVLASSPAAVAGLKAGDRLTHCQEKPLKKPADLFWQLSIVKPGETVTLKVESKNGAKEISFPAGEGL